MSDDITKSLFGSIASWYKCLHIEGISLSICLYLECQYTPDCVFLMLIQVSIFRSSDSKEKCLVNKLLTITKAILAT